MGFACVPSEVRNKRAERTTAGLLASPRACRNMGAFFSASSLKELDILVLEVCGMVKEGGHCPDNTPEAPVYTWAPDLGP